MSAPSGYTALDFVGFTDKGTYSPIVKYMRNDLVHHGGNIMRCKVDDTLNVTPVEGANWELWIGASANLAERTIAPLENNPADVAFGVGRQIIYDDWLWEVIAPIAVGDALIDYDVDPTNANIKKSPPVETQLLAVKAEADATDNMIAPTEASASSSSAPYSVGDQLILNNILYDVIAAIQIGDALTTGTGGNIAAADTLTDQLNAKANSSDLAAVATSGAYSDLSGKPTLATVATSGSYNDLSNKPTLGTAAAKDSTNAVTTGSTDLVESGAVASELATVNSSIQTLEGNDEAVLNVLGAKNLLPNNATSQTINGVTFTVNSDGSVNVNRDSTSSSNSIFYISRSFVVSTPSILSGCPVGGGVDSYVLVAYDGTNYYGDSNEGVEIPIGTYDIYILVYSTSNISNKTFYPMIRPASIEDDTYVPHAMTNRELTDLATVVKGAITPATGVTVTSLFVEKYGKIVTINGYIIANVPSGSSTNPFMMGTIEDGFRPKATVRTNAGIAEHAYDVSTHFAYLVITTDGEIQLKTARTGASAVYFSLSYTTN